MSPPRFQAVGGTIWHGIKGFRNSPRGERRIGAITAIKMRAPVLGGNFGVCTFSLERDKNLVRVDRQASMLGGAGYGGDDDGTLTAW